MKLSAVEINTYEPITAINLNEALTAALDAMISYGSNSEHLETVAALLVLAKQEQHRHFRESEQSRNAKMVA